MSSESCRDGEGELVDELLDDSGGVDIVEVGGQVPFFKSAHFHKMGAPLHARIAVRTPGTCTAGMPDMVIPTVAWHDDAPEQHSKAQHFLPIRHFRPASVSLVPFSSETQCPGTLPHSAGLRSRGSCKD